MREKLMQGKRMSAHQGTYATALLGLAALAACADTSGEPALELGTAQQALGGGALLGLTSAQNDPFLQGKDAFEEIETLADGLGPVFNEKACGNCHDQGATGGPGNQFEVRAGRLTGSTFDPLIAQGGQLFDLNSVVSLPASQRQGIPNCTLTRDGEP